MDVFEKKTKYAKYLPNKNLPQAIPKFLLVRFTADSPVEMAPANPGKFPIRGPGHPSCPLTKC
jgi:hypothetical protein